jgi:hypothetical protein
MRFPQLLPGSGMFLSLESLIRLEPDAIQGSVQLRVVGASHPECASNRLFAC